MVRSRLSAYSDSVIDVEVVGVRVEMPSNQPVLLLREVSGTRFLPIWIGAVEATAIAFAQQDVEPPRPLTHDLLVMLLAQWGHELIAVHRSLGRRRLLCKLGIRRRYDRECAPLRCSRDRVADWHPNLGC